VDLDADDAEAVALLGILLADVQTPTYRSGRGAHWLFRAPSDRQLRFARLDLGHGHDAELRVNGIVVVPPSRHQSGRDYTWTVSPVQADFAEVPDAVFALAPLLPAIVGVPGDDGDGLDDRDDGEPHAGLHLVRLERPNARLRDGRKRALWRQLGFWINEGLGFRELVSAGAAWTDASCEPPLSRDYVATAARDMLKTRLKGGAPRRWPQWIRVSIPLLLRRDPDTVDLTDTMRFRLLQLMAVYWTHGELPAEPRLCGQLIGARHRGAFPALLQRFFPLGDDGKRHHAVLDEEREAVAAKSRTRQRAADMRWHGGGEG
jgi:hypothetical protein